MEKQPVKKNLSKWLVSVLLPILGAAYPVIFLYSHNVKIMEVSSGFMPLLAEILIALVMYGLFLLVFRKPYAAGLSALAFIFFLNTYGFVFDKLIKLDRVPLEHYKMLPLFIFLAVYGAVLLSKLKSTVTRQISTLIVVILAGLNLFNIAGAVPVEIRKAQAAAEARQAAHTASQSGEGLPDIYFIILDEYAGFDALSQYWKYDGYKEFASSLEEKGFFVADHSRSLTFDTLMETASRLNLKAYDYSTGADTLFHDISDNLVMRELKSRGYTTVIFDGAATAYPTKTEVIADYNFKYDPEDSQQRALSVDDFAIMLLDQSMFRVFASSYKSNDSTTDIYRGMILLTLSQITELDDIPSPKFVYAHILSPHTPFMFDEFGRPVDSRNKFNWNYYLGQHKFISNRIDEVVEKILEQSDPARPPIIVLQSDHGARNRDISVLDAVYLQNYPEDLMYSILNALYLPGYDYSQLSEDMNPIHTFEIILNHYMQAGVKVEE